MVDFREHLYNHNSISLGFPRIILMDGQGHEDERRDAGTSSTLAKGMKKTRTDEGPRQFLSLLVHPT